MRSAHTFKVVFGIGVAAGIGSGFGSAYGLTRCMAYTFSDDKPMEAKDDPSITGHKAGEQWGPVTQVEVDKKTGEAFYCAHGDYCYPASREWVSNCVIAHMPDDNDPDTQFYSAR